MNHALPAILLVLPILLVGITLPWLGRTRQGIVFGVTVPLDFAASAEAKALIRRYQIRIAALIAVLVAATIIAAFKLSDRGLAIASLIASPLEIAGATIFWIQSRRAVRPHATRVPLERTAALTSESTGIIPLILMLLSLLPLAIEALWLRLHWSLIPARWPQHWNARGVVDGYGHRSTGGVFAPLLVGAIITLLMVAVAAFMRSASGSQSQTRRRVLAPLAALGWLMSLLFCMIGLLPLAHNLTPQTIVLAAVAHTVLLMAVIVWLLWRSGLSNMMSPSTQPAAEPYDGTPDTGWRAGGMLYYNPTDAAVLVSKRFGIGWDAQLRAPCRLALSRGNARGCCSSHSHPRPRPLAHPTRNNPFALNSCPLR